MAGAMMAVLMNLVEEYKCGACPPLTPELRSSKWPERLALFVLAMLLLVPACAAPAVPVQSTLGPPPATSPVAAARHDPPPVQVISWEDAGDWVGERMIVQGTVVGTRYAMATRGRPTFLNFHDPHPGHFYCLIWDEDRPKFPPDPERYYLGQHVQVRGLIETHRGVPQVILYEAWQIRLAAAGEEWPGMIPAVEETAPAVGVPVQVVRVVDGDTIEIEGGQRVRYIGVDAPEAVHPSKAVECFGREASEKNRGLVEGKSVRLESDVADEDEYGRLLRYVWVDDLMVNAELVRLGYAYSGSYPPNIRYQQLFLRLERQARGQDLGLWEECE